MTIVSKLLQVLTPEERKKMGWHLVPLLIGMVLEMSSLGMVIPAIYVIIKPDFFNNPMLQPYLNALGNPSHLSLAIFGILTLVFIYLIKTLFLTFLAWRQNKLLFDLRNNLSYRLFTGYLKQPWTFHSQRNSSDLFTSASTEINVFINWAMASLMTLLSESLAIIGIMLVLFYVQPVGTLLMMGTIGLIVIGIRQFTNHRVYRWGKDRQHHEYLRSQHLQQGLHAVKDIKLLGRENYFFEHFKRHNDASSHASRLQETFQQLPRLWFELIAIVALAVLILVMLHQHKPLELILPIIGFFAASAFRLIPSVTRIINAIHTFEFSIPTINSLSEEFKLLQSVPPQATNKGVMEFKNTISMDKLAYKYPSTEKDVLKNVCLTIQAGSLVGIVGVSGAGKSTLVDILLGLITPCSGVVKVDGVNIQTNLRGWQNQIGFVPQTIYLSDSSLRCNIAFGIAADAIDEIALQKAIKAAQLEEYINSLPEGLETNVGERGVRLSGGQRQRVGIARALYHDPSVLVFDESTNALDNATEEAIMESVNNLRGLKTIIIIAHRLSTIKNCNQIFKIEKGKVVEENDFEALCNATANHSFSTLSNHNSRQ